VGVYSFDGSDLKMMLCGAVERLWQSKDSIDALNVFPVPDGDTGTNMYHTLSAAVEEALATETDHIGLVADAAAKGALVGARGNSGVILSQVLRGFANSLRLKDRATAEDLAEAFEDGTNTAYKAVMHPVEGTILTVVRRTAEEAAAQRSRDLLRMIVAVVKKAMAALQETPGQLPILKDAGVVDAGGQGFVVMLEGCISALKAASPTTTSSLTETKNRISELVAKEEQLRPANTVENIIFGYCTELLIDGDGLLLEKIKRNLTLYGDSLMVVGSEDVAKVHIHSNHPGLVLEECLKYGTLTEIKISNMREQNKAMRSESIMNSHEQGFGIISVGFGAGIIEIMKNLGADLVINGGQTLNPSTGDILKSIEDMRAERIIILPNNKNVVMAAEQAGALSLKEIIVIPSLSLPQGFSALLTLNPGDDFTVAAQKMNLALASVQTGEITRAIRDSNYAGMKISKNSIIGLVDGDIKTYSDNMADVMTSILTEMLHEEGKIVTLYYGQSVSYEEAESLLNQMMQKFSNQEFELQNGGQPVYDFIISVE
jgi:DAK2 domain fusion protein YloV